MDKVKIVKVLKNASYCKGIVYSSNLNHELGYEAKYMDNYLAIGVLGELIEKGIIELKFNDPKNNKDKERLDYLKRLLEEE